MTQASSGLQALDSTVWRTVLGFRLLAIPAPRLRRIVQLVVGLSLFGIALAFTVAADYGTNPWTVFAQGVAERTGASVGTVVALTGLSLLVISAPLREPLGLGTALNVVVIGPVIDAALWVLGEPSAVAARVALLAVAPVVLGLASGLYLGAGLGPGPRDGLMTAFARRGMSIGRARTAIELTVLVVGWALGGVVGVGTVYFGVTVGYWVRVFLERIPQPSAD